MKLVFSQSKLPRVAERWATQYPADRWPDRQETLVQLQGLAPTATPDEVATIIGNKSWSHFTCDECRQEVTRAVVVGDDSYCEHEVTLCVSCARAAAALASADVGSAA